MKWVGPTLLLILAVATLLVGYGMGPWEGSGRLEAIAPLVAAALAIVGVYLLARARRSSRDMGQR